MTWSLTWFLFEMVGDDWIGVTTEELLTLWVKLPPSVDVRSMASVRVNDAGDAEWAVLTGSAPRSQVIQPHANSRAVGE